MRLSDDEVRGRSSHWLHQALDEDRDLAEPLEGEAQADVCIVGGGYMGLWTAMALRQADPGLGVVLIEADICGGGSSGRNSGMALGAWSKFAALAALGSEEQALAVSDATRAVIDELEAFCAAEGIDCWFDRVGWVWGATCEAQNGAWEDALRRLERHGRAPARRIGRDEIAALTGSTAMVGGVLDESAATIHPGFLARGLRRAALRLGVRIHQKTPMRRFSRSAEPVVDTPRGRVRCGTLVLALNAHAAAIPELAPAIFNISSDDVVSQPMPERLEAASYRRGPLMIDSRVFVSGWRTTRDGRLVAG